MVLGLEKEQVGSGDTCSRYRAATFTPFPVTKTADTNDGTCDADCSLREAIDAANTNPGADDVPVPAGTYLLTLGQLVVSDDVDIVTMFDQAADTRNRLNTVYQNAFAGFFLLLIVLMIFLDPKRSWLS